MFQGSATVLQKVDAYRQAVYAMLVWVCFLLMIDPVLRLVRGQRRGMVQQPGAVLFRTPFRTKDVP